MSFLEPYFEKIEGLGPVFKQAGDRADAHACRIIELLEEIRDATQTLYDAGTALQLPSFVFDAAGAAGAKRIDGREGYVYVIRNIGATTGGSSSVDIHLGTSDDAGFVYRLALGAAGKFSAQPDIKVPENTPIFVMAANAGVGVNLQIERVGL